MATRKMSYSGPSGKNSQATPSSPLSTGWSPFWTLTKSHCWTVASLSNLTARITCCQSQCRRSAASTTVWSRSASRLLQWAAMVKQRYPPTPRPLHTSMPAGANECRCTMDACLLLRKPRHLAIYHLAPHLSIISYPPYIACSSSLEKSIRSRPQPALTERHAVGAELTTINSMNVTPHIARPGFFDFLSRIATGPSVQQGWHRTPGSHACKLRGSLEDHVGDHDRPSGTVILARSLQCRHLVSDLLWKQGPSVPSMVPCPIPCPYPHVPPRTQLGYG